MPTEIGEKPLERPVIKRLEVEKLERWDGLSETQSIKRSTPIHLALCEYLADQNYLA